MLRRLLAIAALLLVAPHPHAVTGLRLAGEASISASRSSEPRPFLQRLDGESERAGARVDDGPVVGRASAACSLRKAPLAASATLFSPEDAPRTTVRHLPGRRIPRMGPVEPPRA